MSLVDKVSQAARPNSERASVAVRGCEAEARGLDSRAGWSRTRVAALVERGDDEAAMGTMPALVVRGDAAAAGDEGEAASLLERLVDMTRAHDPL